MWILLVLAYGLIKGAREIVKKQALKTNGVIEVLFFYTLLSFLMIVPESGKSFFSPPPQIGLIAIKSFVIFCAWIMSFKAIKKMPISFYGVLDLSRVLFATLLGIVVLNEKVGTYQIIGLICVCTGLVLLPFQNRFQEWRMGKKNGTVAEKTNEKTEHVSKWYILIAVISCMLNSLSGLLDKILMKDGDLESGELQFWYMLFLLLFYLGYVVVRRVKISWGTLVRNKWLWILSLLFVLADRALFVANASPDSKVTIMTLIKQSGCLVTILGGKFVFKEKNITYKLICATIIVAGIVIAVL